VKNAIQAGFHTVNLDLLYRLPRQTFDDWRHDLQTAINFGPQGITIYEYIIHSGSNTEKLIRVGILQDPVDRETTHAWYIWARQLLNDEGYIEHRKGSFSKPGHKQMYGALSYGEGCELIGLGAGAYSFINGFQFRAPDNSQIFKAQINNGMFPLVDLISPKATERNLRERFIIFQFMSSRMYRAEYQRRFGNDALEDFPHQISKLRTSGLVEIRDDQIILTDLGIAERNLVLYEFYDKSFLTKDFKNRAYLK
jgi:oxygen-independent coproporphyrinogen-3 oxidase